MTVCLGSGFFFFNDTATTEIYTLSLHDALPIFLSLHRDLARRAVPPRVLHARAPSPRPRLLRALLERQEGTRHRSEEHTSELQSRQYLVCRLLLEKKKQLALLLPDIPHTLFILF